MRLSLIDFLLYVISASAMYTLPDSLTFSLEILGHCAPMLYLSDAVVSMLSWCLT